MAPNVHQDSAKKQPIAISTPLQAAPKDCPVPAGMSKEAYWAEQELQKKNDFVFSANHVVSNTIRASEHVEEAASVVNNTTNVAPASYWEEKESTNVGDSQA